MFTEDAVRNLAETFSLLIVETECPKLLFLLEKSFSAITSKVLIRLQKKTSAMLKKNIVDCLGIAVER